MPPDFNYLINIIKLIDGLCEEARLIDSDLNSKSPFIFFEHVSKAFIVSLSAEILPLTDKFRKLGVFVTTNKDVLSHL